MDIPIPVATKHTATVTLSAMKAVHCENCGYDYLYEMEREAAGAGTNVLFLDEEGARERARQQATRSAAERLRSETELVPCPQCGWIQSRMLPLARRQHRLGMLIAAVVLLSAAGVAALVNLNYSVSHGGRLLFSWFYAAVLLATGIAFAGTWIVLVICHDPNALDVEQRKAMSTAWAIGRVEWEKLVAEQAREPAKDAPPH